MRRSVNPPMIMRQIELGKGAGATRMGWVGVGGGEARELVTEHVTIDNRNYGQVEDVHMFLAHCASQCFLEWVTNGRPG